jgi:hypothetical protein
MVYDLSTVSLGCSGQSTSVLLNSLSGLHAILFRETELSEKGCSVRCARSGQPPPANPFKGKEFTC